MRGPARHPTAGKPVKRSLSYAREPSLNVLELFAGIGGMALGLERAGMTPVGFVEINPWCRQILAKHWPAVPLHDDVRTTVEWWTARPRPVVHVVAGGYPCQPESVVGPKRGTSDDRWLWPDMARVIHALRPRYVIGENVVGHRTRGLRFVLRDLESLGYTARAGLIAASEVGAPHVRRRIFTLAEVANPHGIGRVGALHEAQAEGTPGWPATERSDWWTTEPGLGGVAYGVPDRVDRLRGLGNAVVPQVAEYMGRLLLSGEWRHV